MPRPPGCVSRWAPRQRPPLGFASITHSMNVMPAVYNSRGAGGLCFDASVAIMKSRGAKCCGESKGGRGAKTRLGGSGLTSRQATPRPISLAQGSRHRRKDTHALTGEPSGGRDTHPLPSLHGWPTFLRVPRGKARPHTWFRPVDLGQNQCMPRPGLASPAALILGPRVTVVQSPPPPNHLHRSRK